MSVDEKPVESGDGAPDQGAPLSPEAAREVERLQAELEAKGLGEVSAKSKWWGFEIHLDATAAQNVADITEQIGEIAGHVLGGNIGKIAEAGAKIRAAWIRAVGSNYGCKLVSPWIAPGMLIPISLGPKDDTNLWWTVFEPSSGWSGSTKFVENFTKDKPALAEFQTKLICAHVGDGDSYVWWSIYDPSLDSGKGGWGPSEKIPGARSKAGPALAVYRNKLHLVHRGDADDSLWHATFDGSRWSSSTRLGSYSSHAPALAVYGDKLILVHKGNSNNNLWWSEFNGTSWGGGGRINTASTASDPALAVYNNALHCVHRGNSDTDLWHMSYDGRTWSSGTRMAEKRSKAGPALAVFNNELYCVARGASDQSLWWTKYKQGSGWSNYVRLAENYANAGPALIVYRDKDGTKDQLLCVHRGSGTSGRSATTEEPETEETPIG